MIPCKMDNVNMTEIFKKKEKKIKKRKTFFSRTLIFFSQYIEQNNYLIKF